MPIYVITLSAIGMVIAFYHVLLQYGIIAEQLSPCQNGVSCTTEYINWFGFVNIPLLSFLAFTTITLSMVYFKKFGVFADPVIILEKNKGKGLRQKG